MRHLLTATMLMASFVGCATMVQGQDRRWGEYPPDRVTRLINRVNEDLNRGYAGWHFNAHDRERLETAVHELHQFGNQWQRDGRFNKDALDATIETIHRVVDDNHMVGPARDALDRDLGALRRMREAYDRQQIGR